MTGAPNPALAPCNADKLALEELDAILSRAFGIADGYLELNGIISGAVDYDLYQQLGLTQAPMRIVIANLRIALTANGMGRSCLQAVFETLTGNAALRDWIGRNCPPLLFLVPQAAFEQARPAYEAERMQRRVKAITFILDTTAKLKMTLGTEGRELARQMSELLYDLGSCKSIHDQLHGLQMEAMAELIRVSAGSISVTDRKISLGTQSEKLVSACECIAKQFRHPTASLNARSQRDLVIAQIRDIIAALQAGNPEAAETAEAVAGLLRSLLRQQMSLFDSRIVETSEKIPFQAFAAVLRGLKPEGQDPEILETASQGFEDIETSLRVRRSVHQLWQQVESTLVNLEELLRGTGRTMEMQFHCKNLTEMIRKISALSFDVAVLDLLRLADLAGPDGKATLPDTETFKQVFPAFARAARTRFQRADSRLLDDCEQLEELQAPLHALLGDLP